MKWLESVELKPGGADARVRDQHRTRHVVPVGKAISKVLHSPRVMLEIEADWSTWQQSDSEEYLQRSGFDADHASHLVYSFQHEFTRVLVPAVTLMHCILPPFAVVVEHAFKLNGLDFLCTPNLEELGTVEFADKPPPAVRDFHKRQLSWLACFPTARQCWNSIRQHAVAGTVGLDLPQARVHVRLLGQQFDRAFLVSKAVLVRLTTLESPLPFAAEHPRQLVFQTRDCRTTSAVAQWQWLFTADGRYELSDLEWQNVQPFTNVSVHGGGPNGAAFCRRKALNGMLHQRLFASQLFRDSTFADVDAQTVVRWQRKMVDFGNFDQAVSVLRSLGERHANPGAPRSGEHAWRRPKSVYSQ